MTWGLVDANGIVRNIIEYTGEGNYSPPSGMTLAAVSDWCLIGHPANITREEADAIIRPQRNDSTPPEPTKAELLTQVQALLAKVEALSE